MRHNFLGAVKGRLMLSSRSVAGGWGGERAKGGGRGRVSGCWGGEDTIGV